MRATKRSRNPNLNVAITHARYVCSEILKDFSALQCSSTKEAGGTAKIVVVSGSATNYTFTNLKKCTDYLLRIRVNNGNFDGPWSPERRVGTEQHGRCCTSCSRRSNNYQYPKSVKITGH